MKSLTVSLTFSLESIYGQCWSYGGCRDREPLAVCKVSSCVPFTLYSFQLNTTTMSLLPYNKTKRIIVDLQNILIPNQSILCIIIVIRFIYAKYFRWHKHVLLFCFAFLSFGLPFNCCNGKIKEFQESSFVVTNSRFFQRQSVHLPWNKTVRNRFVSFNSVVKN